MQFTPHLERPAASATNRTIIITGAGSGIGLAAFRHAIAAGDNVVLVGRDEAKLEAAVDSLSPTDRSRALTLPLDLIDPIAHLVIIAAALSQFGRIDGIVHSAGIWRTTGEAEPNADDLDDQWLVNVRGPFVLTQAAIPHLRAGSSIVFIGSAAGLVGVPGMVAYCATKGAVEQLAKAFAAELAPQGIKVNCVAPGNIDTPMTSSRLAEPEYLGRALSLTPANRLGSAENVADAIAFLLSTKSDFIHGATIRVDGGLTAV